MKNVQIEMNKNSTMKVFLQNVFLQMLRSAIKLKYWFFSMFRLSFQIHFIVLQYFSLESFRRILLNKNVSLLECKISQRNGILYDLLENLSCKSRMGRHCSFPYGIAIFTRSVAAKLPCTSLLVGEMFL